MKPSVAERERRRFARYVPVSATVGHIFAKLSDTGVPVRIEDISLGGMCLVFDHAFPEGAVVTLEVGNRVTGARCTVQLRVVHVALLEAGWFVGGAFTEKLADADLVALLPGVLP